MPLNRSLCIVMPAYNEEEIIEKTVRHCHRDVASKFKDSKIIVVDDKSSDKTPDILESLKKDIPRLVVLRNENNMGHGASLLRGISEAKCDLVFLIDTDYQHVPADFWILYEHIETYQIVTGIRSRRHDPFYRIIFSKIGNIFTQILLRTSIRDINIPFKLIQGETMERLVNEIPSDTKIPSALFMIAAVKLNYKIKQKPVKHIERQTGRPSLPGARFLRFAMESLSEIISFAKT